MSNTKQRILRYIAAYIKENEYSPSVREIADGVGLLSTSTVHCHLYDLKESGYIEYQKKRPRTIRILRS